jgi:hypothetical protein
VVCIFVVIVFEQHLNFVREVFHVLLDVVVDGFVDGFWLFGVFETFGA